MLQRALASLLCLLGIAAIGLGVASATLWRPADTLAASLRADDGIVVTQPGVLDLAADSVTVSARAASGPVVLALGRSQDVAAWVGTDPATFVSGLASRTALEGDEATATPTATGSSDPAATSPPGEASADPSAEATAEATAGATEPAAEPAAAEARPDPAGSDLWLQEASGTPTARLTWTSAPGRWSVLAVATAGGPVTLELTWPQVVTTPWRAPGIVVGSFLLLAGLVWWGLLLLSRYRPDAVLGLVATTAQWRTALRGSRSGDAGSGGVELDPAREATALVPSPSLEHPGPGEGGRRARRALEAAGSAAEGSGSPGTPTASSSGPTALPTMREARAATVDEPMAAPADGVLAEPAVTPGTEPAPMTRRALREQRERADRERAGKTSQDAPAVDARAGQAQQDAGARPLRGAPPFVTEPRAVVRPAPAALGTGPVVVPEPGTDLPAAPLGGTASAGPPNEGEPAPRRRFPFGRRRPVLSGAGPAGPAEVVPEPEPEPAVESAEPTPSTSADQWRRAWGLPAGGTVWTPVATGDDHEPSGPTTPTEETR